MEDRKPTWQQLARHLGERMRHYAFCPHHGPGERNPADCPFCADWVAFEQYQRKIGEAK